MCDRFSSWALFFVGTLREGPGPSQRLVKIMKPHVRRVLGPFQIIFFELDPPKPGAYMSGFSKNI